MDKKRKIIIRDKFAWSDIYDKENINLLFDTQLSFQRAPSARHLDVK